jgi:hypothetical protein
MPRAGMTNTTYPGLQPPLSRGDFLHGCHSGIFGTPEISGIPVFGIHPFQSILILAKIEID